MISFITRLDATHSHQVVKSKEELLEVIGKLYDLNVINNCTYFDIIIDTDGEKESLI